MCILVLKPASHQEMLGGLQTSKETPMIASALQLWQIHLGVRISLILHQDVAEMFVNMVPIKLEQLLKTSSEEGSCRSTRWDLWPESLAWASILRGARNSLIHSERGIYLRHVIVSSVNHPRTSLGLLAPPTCHCLWEFPMTPRR